MIWEPFMISRDAMFIVVMLSLTLLSPMMVKTHIVARSEKELPKIDENLNHFENSLPKICRSRLLKKYNTRGSGTLVDQTRVG